MLAQAMLLCGLILLAQAMSSYVSPVVVVVLELVARVNVVWLKLLLWRECIHRRNEDELYHAQMS